MKSSLSHTLRLGALALFGSLSVDSAAFAADTVPAPATAKAPTSRHSELVIADGKIADVAINGQPAPATLRNLADVLMRRYPAVTINLVGVDQMIVGDLRLRLPGEPNLDEQQADAVTAILEAVSAAFDGRALSISRPSLKQFVLSRPPGGAARSARNIDVFNLRQYLEGGGDRAALETQLRHGQLELNALDEQSDRISRAVDAGSAHPSQRTEIKNKIAEVQNQYDLVARKLARLNPTPEEKAKRIDQLTEVVRSTLAKLGTGEKVPEFEYHDGTHLLIVIGSETALEVTRKVVTALEKSSD